RASQKALDAERGAQPDIPRLIEEDTQPPLDMQLFCNNSTACLRQISVLFQTTIGHYRNKDYNKAIQAFRDAYEVTHAPSLQLALARAQHRNGDLQEALASYQKYRQLVDGDPEFGSSPEEAVRQQVALSCATRAQAELDHRHELTQKGVLP